ncbi:Hpt domain-containing protein [Endozoicomonas sp. OPT23]|uniref:hybrid sensor histidine kinase/response regulator n=1 Tax=Endozoicomonas sp. OPT23 TaxID=2072845 RepID=UPI00351AE510
MTPLSRAAALLERCARHIQLEWVEHKSLPEKEELEHLADAVTSVEYYLERLDDKVQSSHDAILDVAEESLNALNPLIEEAQLSKPETLDEEQSFLDGSAPIAFDSEIETVNSESPLETVSSENVIEFDFSAAHAADTEVEPEQEVTSELTNTLDFPASDSILTAPEVAETVEVSTGSSLNEEIDDSLIDDELLEVFIEEAGDVQRQLAEGVPLWLSNQEDNKTLADMRRAFHTLKGSGRMVGANVVGELAWSVENMLNRLIDGTIQSTHELRLLLDQVAGMLPSLIDDFAKQNQVLTPEVLECMEKADALAKGEQYTIPGDDTASEPKNIADFEDDTTNLEFNTEEADLVVDLSSFEAADIEESVVLSQSLSEVTLSEELLSEEAATATETEDSTKTDYDVQLLNVFLSESHLHLETVQHFVDQVKAQEGKRQISDNVQRSLHTLKGIALMTEIAPLANLIVALEKNIKDFRAHLIPADDRVINMLEKGLELIDDGLQQLSVSANEPSLELEDYLGWLEALHAQLLSEQQKQEEGSRIYTGGQKSDLFADVELRVLLDADLYLNKWKDRLSADELMEFMAELGCIRSRSQDATLEAMAELCDVLTGVVNYLYAHEQVLPGVLSAPLSNGFEALIDMMNQVAAQQTPISPQSVFSELRKSLEELLTPTVEKFAAEEVPLNLSEEPDVEEITLEASEDLEWADDIDVDTLETSFDAGDAEEMILESMFEGSDSTSDLLHEPEEIVLAEPYIDNAAIEPVAAAEIAIEAEQVNEPAPSLNIEVEEHDLELQELFLEEAGDLLEDSNLALEQWLHDVKNTLPLAELQRILHTLKGSARMADQPDIGDLSHALEDVYSAITNGRQGDNPPLRMIQAAHDHIDLMIQTLKNQQTPPSVTPLIERLESWVLNNEDLGQDLPVQAQLPETEELPDYLGQSETITFESDTLKNDDLQRQTVHKEALDTKDVVAVAKVQPPVVNDSLPKTQVLTERTEPVATRVDTPVTQNLVKNNELIRVPALLIEQLINLSGESSINRGRIEQQIQDISHTLEEMDSTIDRVKEQLRRLDTETQAQIISTYDGEEADNPEFDPLEMDQYSELTQLSRSLVESATDLKDLKEAIQDKNRDAETLLLQQHRTQLDLQEKLIQARMVSFSRLLPRLRKISRQLSSELGKPANLNVTNAEGEMDRTMLERMLAPLEHMLRNAIGHGLEESSDDRLAKGKSAEGNLDLSISRDGADIVLELKDDGRGIDLEKVHAKAVEKRLISPNDQLTDQEMAELILEPGFTTADSITQISGRGVGLDIVNTEIRQLGGSIHIHSEKDLGTTITLRLPFTLSVNRALMVAIGENLYALPMQAIDGISTVAPDVLTDCYQNSKPLMYAGQEHKVMFLGELLGTSRPRIQAEQCPVIIIQRGGQNLALHVDEVIGGREIFTKSLGPQFTGLIGVNGATILGDGRVVIIIDPAALARRQRTVSRKVSLTDDSKSADIARRVLVVDDSVTVRKVTTRLLERSGFEVESARDGVEAMTRLSESNYDIMLLDIEMPKMDGYEVASAVRNDSRIAALPIIMITSRTGEKHKTRAFSLGVNEYLGKPFQETTLLSSIDKLIGARKGVI